MSKRVLFLILVLAAAGFATWYFFFMPADEPVAVLQQPTTGQPEIISTGQALSPVASHDNNKIWYGTTSGVLRRYELATGQETEYAGPRPPAEPVMSLIWPVAGNDLIFETLSAGQKRYHYYNSTAQAYVTLPEQVLNLDWLNDGRRIVYTWRAADGQTQLVTANADGSGYRRVADVPWDDLVPLASPTEHKAILYRPNAEGPINKAYLFDLETGAYEELVAEGWTTGVRWSPDGLRVVVSMQQAGQDSLHVYDAATKAGTATGIPAGIAAAAVSEDGVYLYALSGKFVIRYNMISGEQTVHRELAAPLSAKSLLVVGQEVFYLGFDGMIRSVN